MARHKRHEEEHENLERWLVSYADFITLLFAFFVVMYSISSVNEGKYRVLSDTLAEVFTSSHVGTPSGSAIRIGEGSGGENVIGQPKGGLGQVTPVVIPETGKGEERTRMEGVASRIEAVLAPYIQEDLAVIHRNESWIEVEMKSGLLFQSGSAKLEEDALPILYRLSEILRDLPNPIHIEGHTDNVPIHRPEFPGNWALSAARAADVVEQLARDGLDPKRMAAIGYGEYHPVADNGTEEGRYKNRRVVLLLLSAEGGRYPMPEKTPAEETIKGRQP